MIIKNNCLIMFLQRGSFSSLEHTLFSVFLLRHLCQKLSKKIATYLSTFILIYYKRTAIVTKWTWTTTSPNFLLSLSFLKHTLLYVFLKMSYFIFNLIINKTPICHAIKPPLLQGEKDTRYIFKSSSNGKRKTLK